MKTANFHQVSGFIGKKITNISTAKANVTKFTICHSMGKGNDSLFVDLVAFENKASEKKSLHLSLIKESAPVLVTYRIAPNNFEKGGRKFYRTQNIVTAIEAISLEDADASAESDVAVDEETGEILD